MHSILENGLKISIGRNSKLIGEDEPMIYLSNKNDIPYWKALLQIPHPVVFQVQIENPPEPHEYSHYSEYLIDTDIPATQISLAKNLKPDTTVQKAMKKICRGQAFELGYVCVYIIKHYERNTIEEIDLKYIKSFLAVTERLNFDCYSQKRWRNFLTIWGENGEYTFCDKYAVKHTENMPALWQKLTMYPNDELTDIRTRISNLIQTTFHDCLDLCTGGWTG